MSLENVLAMDPVEFEVTKGLWDEAIKGQSSDTEEKVETELQVSVHRGEQTGVSE